MWVIFRDPKTAFNHLDKFVVELVEDKDILTYQAVLHKTVGGRTFPLNTDVWFAQRFATSVNDVEYIARRYPCWSPDHHEIKPTMDTYLS